MVFSAFRVNSSGSLADADAVQFTFHRSLKKRRRLAVIFANENPRPSGQHHVGMDGKTEVFFKDFPNLNGLDSPFTRLIDADCQIDVAVFDIPMNGVDDVIFDLDGPHAVFPLMGYLFIGNRWGLIEALQNRIQSVLAEVFFQRPPQGIDGVIGNGIISAPWST